MRRLPFRNPLLRYLPHQRRLLGSHVHHAANTSPRHATKSAKPRVPKLQCRGHGSRPIYFSSSGASTESEERVDQAQEPANLMEGHRRDDPCSYDRHRRRDEPEH